MNKAKKTQKTLV